MIILSNNYRTLDLVANGTQLDQRISMQLNLENFDLVVVVVATVTDAIDAAVVVEAVAVVVVVVVVVAVTVVVCCGH